MKKIGTVGSATQDIFILYEGAETLHFQDPSHEKSYLIFEQGTKIDVPKLHYATGGGSTNTAVGLRRLGHEVEAFFKVGNDTAGNYILLNMAAEDIGINHVIRDSTADTAISFIIPSREHNHVVFAYRAANQTIKQDEFPLFLLESVDYLYISPLSGHSRSLLAAIAPLAHKQGIPIALNPGMGQIAHESDEFLALLPYCNVLIVNAYEAGHLMKALRRNESLIITKKAAKHSEGKTPQLFEHFISSAKSAGSASTSAKSDTTKLTIIDYFKEILKRGPSIAVVTNGVEGVYVAHHDTVFFHPSIKTKVVSGLGAGDAFSSAFVSYIAQEKRIEEAIIAGVINASSVIQLFDAKQGLLTKKELEKRVRELGEKELKRYPIRN